jgi:modification target Cys-rich repeat protein
MMHKNFGLSVLLAAAALSSACGDDPASNPALVAAAEACDINISCEGAGIAEGNAAISGLASVDTFFQSVINFQAKADSISGSIDVELDAIRTTFGLEAGADIGAGIKAQAMASGVASLKLVAEPARCSVDAQASVQASARCEGMVDPGSVEVECKGSCEADVTAEVMCDASADVECTFQGPSIECEGSCTGTCTLEASATAECSGTCNGTCDGECSLMNAEGECQGKCEGTCEGSCEVEMKAGAMCEGTCRGECTATNPSGGCEGSVRASCKAKGDASVMCEGSCDGEVTPPSASVECEASAKAEASLNVECSPPRVELQFELMASADVEAQAEFTAKLKVLEARLPRILASLKRADLVLDAGEGLATDGAAAVKGAIDGSAMAVAEGNLRVVFGIPCAVKELDKVEAAISGSIASLSGSVSAAAEITTALK